MHIRCLRHERGTIDEKGEKRVKRTGRLVLTHVQSLYIRRVYTLISHRLGVDELDMNDFLRNRTVTQSQIQDSLNELERDPTRGFRGDPVQNAGSGSLGLPGYSDSLLEELETRANALAKAMRTHKGIV